MLKMIRKNKKGFTLVELIVVIAILGILATIAVPRLTGFRDDASTSADNATYQTVERAAAIYQADNSISGTVTWTKDGTGTGDDWKEYFTEWPQNSDGTDYTSVVITATDITVND